MTDLYGNLIPQTDTRVGPSARPPWSPRSCPPNCMLNSDKAAAQPAWPAAMGWVTLWGKAGTVIISQIRLLSLFLLWISSGIGQLFFFNPQNTLITLQLIPLVSDHTAVPTPEWLFAMPFSQTFQRAVVSHELRRAGIVHSGLRPSPSPPSSPSPGAAAIGCPLSQLQPQATQESASFPGLPSREPWPTAPCLRGHPSPTWWGPPLQQQCKEGHTQGLQDHFLPIISLIKENVIQSLTGHSF